MSWRSKEEITASSFWPCTQKQHSHLKLVWWYLHNASGGLWKGWQVQVRIPYPVLQNSQLVSNLVSKELGKFCFMVIDIFTQPQGCDENIHCELSVPLKKTSIPMCFVWQVWGNSLNHRTQNTKALKRISNKNAFWHRQKKKKNFPRLRQNKLGYK